MGRLKLASVLFTLIGSSFAWAGLHAVIVCQDPVTVYIDGPIATGVAATVEFYRAEAGEFEEESGVLMVRSDGSLVANSPSTFVYGNREGSGYFVLAPSQEPNFSGCASITNSPAK